MANINPDTLGVIPQDIIEVYTDGAYSKKRSRMGIGVHFINANAYKDISLEVQLELKTNQRAELCAIYRAIRVIKPDDNIKLYTDSAYCYGIITGWYFKWAKSGKIYKNKDLIDPLMKLIVSRKGLLFIELVKGHSAIQGNIMADFLATSAIKEK